MTRRSGKGRITRSDPGDAAGSESQRPYPSLRQRSPFAFWVAIIGAAAMVISTFATALSAIL